MQTIKADLPDADYLIKTDSYVKNLGNRLLSIDFLRGFIMVLLALESTQLYTNLINTSTNRPVNSILNQFFHHPWHGLHFWDLVQPIFMFVAGSAMAFSLEKQQEIMTWNQSFAKILKRCGWLFFWGVTDYLVREHGLSFELWDVLTQLAFTTLIAFLISRSSSTLQITVSLLFLLIPELLYRFIQIPGFDQPFTNQHNFGNYMDLVLMNKTNPDGWVAINCLSTSAHTIWGLMAGQLLLSNQTGKAKAIKLCTAGLLLLVLGFGMDLTGITPIIKKIATSSFVLASGGFCLLFLAACYWYIDIKNHRKNLLFFTIVGMNSIFIYLFFEIVGERWFNGYINAIAGGLMKLIHLPQTVILIISSCCIFFLEWGICYFLYKKKVFFRI